MTEQELEIIDKDFNEMKKKEYLEMLHHSFPDFLKEFLNNFVKTKFYKKAYKKARSYADEYNFKVDDYFLVDWGCLTLSSSKSYTNEELINGLLEKSQFGLIPHYQYDELKVIVLDFKNKEAHIEQGYAVQHYASYVLKHRRPIPKYMQPLIDKLWKDYDEYTKEKDGIAFDHIEYTEEQEDMFDCI